MALNIGKNIEKKPTALAVSQNMRSKYNITVNEPQQTHFSVEGVQTYSEAEIKAMKNRQESKMQREGEFAKIKTYAVDDKIEFEGIVAPSTATDKQATATLKAKSKAKPQSAKQISSNTRAERPKTAVVKPSIRNEMGRANQKTVKLTKEQQKLQRMQEKLSELTKQYRVHFGQDLKVKKGPSVQKEKGKPEENVGDKNKEQNDEEEDEFAEFEEEGGDQYFPVTKKVKFPQVNKKVETSKASPTKADQDDSFEEVQWQKPVQHIVSSLKQSTHSYSERLGNAVHLLFD